MMGRLALVLALLMLFVATLPVGGANAAPATADEWTGNSSYRVDYVGRDGPNNTDHYRATLDWGASFFAIGAETMPLLPAEQSANMVMDGYRATFPGRPLEDIQPGDSFDFYVPVGTVVATEWRIRGAITEYRSLRGDSLVTYTNPIYPIKHRLTRSEDTGKTEVLVNLEVEPEPMELAQALYGRDDPGFNPDYLQLRRAKEILDKSTQVVTINTTRAHIDDFLEIRGSGKAAGQTEEGLQVYWFESDGTAMPIFRVDDGIGDETDPNLFPSPSRVYYYKDGVVRTYQRTRDTTFLSGRQPNTEEWVKVYAEWGRMESPPTRWEVGQPEQDAQTDELKQLGITVLRFQPKEPPKGNFLTQLLDALLGLMKRESDQESPPE